MSMYTGTVINELICILRKRGYAVRGARLRKVHGGKWEAGGGGIYMRWGYVRVERRYIPAEIHAYYRPSKHIIVCL